jgi:hypothetical protein
VSAEQIKQRNAHTEIPEFKTILREPVKGGYGIASCEEMVRVKDGWVSPGGAKAPIPLTPRPPSDAKK